MIEVFSQKTAYLLRDALASQAQLRYRVFVESRKLPHDHFDGMEYDPFDTPAARYLVWRDESATVRGLMRVMPTNLPYMLQRYWPHLVKDGHLPCSPQVWELTRGCVDKGVVPERRARIVPELLCGMQDLFERLGVRSVIGVSRPRLISTYIRSGVRWLGEPDLVEGQIEAAFAVPTEHIRPILHCYKLNIEKPVLSPVGLDDFMLAA